MQCNANGISIKITELLTFLHNNIKIAAIHKTKQTNKSMLLKTPGQAAEQLDREKNKILDPILRQIGRSSAICRSSSEATWHFDYDAQSPITAHPQHLH